MYCIRASSGAPTSSARAESQNVRSICIFAREVPRAGGDDAVRAGDPSHLASSGLRILQEAHDELREHSVKGVRRPRQGFARSLAHVRSGDPVGARTHEPRGRIGCRDQVRPEYRPMYRS